MVVKSWEDMKTKYPKYRVEMDEKEEKEFVNDCFELYEKEGFANTFWSQDSDYRMYQGKAFIVVGRTPIYDGKNDGADLTCLPMWDIRFEDGTGISAFPDEVIRSEMRNNGCPKKYLA